MTNPAPQFIQTPLVDNRALRVTFVWNRDRFAHTVAAVEGTRLTPLMASADCCDVVTDWPPSPPFQQLSVEKLADGSPVAFLVGMAGKNHWSASIQSVANEAAILFDVAVRTASQPTFAGSSYRTMLPPVAGTSPNTLRFDVGGTRCEIAVAEIRGLAIETSSDGFAIRNSDTPVRFPTTLRWQYTIQVLPPACSVP